MDNKLNNEYEAIYKIMLIGDSNSGKTSLLLKFTEDSFKENTYTTLGQDFKSKDTTIRDKNYKFQIWDTAGQERFRTICHSPYRGVVGIIVVYDITDFQSFDNVRRWIGETERYCIEDIPIVIFGNKVDLVECSKYQRKVSQEVARQFTEVFDIKIYETSAKYNLNIESGFLDLFNKVIERREYIYDPPKKIIPKKDNKNNCNIN